MDSIPFMSRFDSNDNDRPVMHLGGYSLYAPHVIVLGYVISMLLTTICMALNLAAGPFAWLSFTSGQVLSGQVWRLLTYGLLNEPSLFFVIDMFMLAWFGRELEKFFGRRIFLRFYAGLYLLTPVLLTALGLFGWSKSLAGQTGSLGLFIAFATLYPTLAFFFNVQAKWLAYILVGIYSLMHLAYRDLIGLLTLWAVVGFAHGYVRYEQGRFTLPNPLARFRQPKFKVLAGEATEKPRSAAPVGDEAMADVDALLDKIARSGIHSLTAEERARLDRSSAALMRRKGSVRGSPKT